MLRSSRTACVRRPLDGFTEAGQKGGVSRSATEAESTAPRRRQPGGYRAPDAIGQYNGIKKGWIRSPGTCQPSSEILADALLLILVERPSCGHVVDPVPYGLKDLCIFILALFRDTVHYVGILGDSREDGIDQLDDVQHVLLDEAA